MDFSLLYNDVQIPWSLRLDNLNVLFNGNSKSFLNLYYFSFQEGKLWKLLIYHETQGQTFGWTFTDHLK